MNKKYETNLFHYMNKIVEQLFKEPDRSWYSQHFVCNQIFEECDPLIAATVLIKLDTDYNLFQVNFIHSTYDDNDNEVEHEVDFEEYTQALQDPSYTPIDNDTGYPVEHYTPKWLRFEAYSRRDEQDIPYEDVEW